MYKKKFQKVLTHVSPTMSGLFYLNRCQSGDDDDGDDDEEVGKQRSRPIIIKMIGMKLGANDLSLLLANRHHQTVDDQKLSHLICKLFAADAALSPFFSFPFE